HVPGRRVDGVGILVSPRVESEQSLEGHTASLPTATYGAAMCFGTTLTKKRYRPRTSLPSDSASAATIATVAYGTCAAPWTIAEGPITTSGSTMAPSASSTLRPITRAAS